MEAAGTAPANTDTAIRQQCRHVPAEWRKSKVLLTHSSGNILLGRIGLMNHLGLKLGENEPKYF